MIFSILIPTYNRANLLPRAFSSIMSQSFCRNYPNEIEVVVADDGSTDNTEEVVNFYKKYLPIRYIKSEHTGITGKVRNLALYNAKGVYCACLDSDDTWFENHLEKHYLKLTQTNSIITRSIAKFCLIEKMHNGNIIENWTLKDFHHEYRNAWSVLVSSVVFKRENAIKYGGFSEKRCGEEVDLWLKLVKELNIDVSIEEITCSYGFIKKGDNLSYECFKEAKQAYGS